MLRKLTLICSFKRKKKRKKASVCLVFLHDYQVFPFKTADYCKPRKFLCLFRLLCKQTNHFCGYILLCSSPLISKVGLFDFRLYEHTSIPHWKNIIISWANYDKDFPLFLMFCVTLDIQDSYPPFILLTSSSNNFFICPSICGALT